MKFKLGLIDLSNLVDLFLCLLGYPPPDARAHCFVSRYLRQARRDQELRFWKQDTIGHFNARKGHGGHELKDRKWSVNKDFGMQKDQFF